MRVTRLEISSVGGIKDLKLAFNPSMNIICGPNGIGKTTVIESIAHFFSAGQSPILKRHVNSPTGTVKAWAVNEGAEHTGTLHVSHFDPGQLDDRPGLHTFAPYILSLKTTRTFSYKALNSVSKDANKPIGTVWQEAHNGLTLTDVKNWFVNRYLYSAHAQALSPQQIKNFAVAKSCFSLLNPAFLFSKVDASTNEIMVKTPSGELYYEYLSSGFKSCLSILFGIIKEIEFRFKDVEVSAFEGVVLIDELELHLHPEWQSRIAGVLTAVFPNVQFIATTHSPHIIQAAEPSSILALEDVGGHVRLRELPVSEYGFKGWTIEEVLEDVMGMTDTRTTLFNGVMKEYGKAVSDENLEEAERYRHVLDKLLHPHSHLRKLISLQLAALASTENPGEGHADSEPSA